MSFLLLENRLSIDTLVVPGYFIDRFLPAASGTDVKVYLYLLRAVSTSTSGLSSASISDHLEISEREVLRSLSYWEKAGLLRLSFTSEHELSGVAFTDPPTQTTADKAAAGIQTQAAQALAQAAASQATAQGTGAQSVQSVQSIQSAQSVLSSPANSAGGTAASNTGTASGSMAATGTGASPNSAMSSSGNATAAQSGAVPAQSTTISGTATTVSGTAVSGTTVSGTGTSGTVTSSTTVSGTTISGSMPPLHLSQEEQILLENDPEFNMYMSAWAQYFSRPLTYSDTESFGYWYLQFNRSPEVIDYLVDYCANHCKGKLSMKFIDSVAQSWHRKGLHTIDSIREYNQMHNDTVYAVMRAYGLYDQAPSPSQLNYINQWIRDYGFSSDIFAYACDITMLKCQRPSVNFTESVLKRWKEDHVKTLEDAKASEQKREQEQKAKSSAKRGNANRSSSNHANGSVAKGTQQFRAFPERTNGTNSYTEKILKQYRQDS